MKTKLNENNIIDIIKHSKTNSGIIKSLNKNELLLKYIINYTTFLNYESTIYERLYCIKNDINSNYKCNICNKNNLIFDIKYQKYRNWCINNECKKTYMLNNRDIDKEKERINKIKKTKENLTLEDKLRIKEKTKQTNIKKYGVDSYAKTNEFKKLMVDKFGHVSPFALDIIQKKTKETLHKKYGVEHNFKIEGIQKQIENTFVEKYGTKRSSQNNKIKQKIIDTNNKKYGGNSPMCNIEIQKKAKETHLSNYDFYGLSNPEILVKYKKTMLERYGYENVLQNPEIFDKILLKSYKYKNYILPSGKEVFIQGYEDYVIEQLLSKYNENDIIISNIEITQNIGQIFYDFNGKTHKYYPDIYIKSENKIIEVKSLYTYNKDLLINKLKMETCIKMGIKFEFIIVEKKEYMLWKNNKL